MPKYIIEREIPGAAELFSKEKEAISKKSSAVVKELGQVGSPSSEAFDPMMRSARCFGV